MHSYLSVSILPHLKLCLSVGNFGFIKQHLSEALLPKEEFFFFLNGLYDYCVFLRKWLTEKMHKMKIDNYALLGRLLEKAMAPHSTTLAWKILWTEEPGRLQSMGS